MPSSDSADLIALTQRLLDAIDRRDWKTYASLADPSLSAFEPEALGHLIEGLRFHEYDFQSGPTDQPRQSTMSSPRVWMLGEAAVVAYVRVVQRTGPDGHPATSASEETRVWHRRDGAWQHVHFHRSACPQSG